MRAVPSPALRVRDPGHSPLHSRLFTTRIGLPVNVGRRDDLEIREKKLFQLRSDRCATCTVYSGHRQRPKQHPWVTSWRSRWTASSAGNRGSNRREKSSAGQLCRAFEETRALVNRNNPLLYFDRACVDKGGKRRGSQRKRERRDWLDGAAKGRAPLKSTERRPDMPDAWRCTSHGTADYCARSFPRPP